MTLNEDDDPYQEDNFPRRRPEDGDDDDTGRKSKKLRIVDEASESLDHILESGSQDRELNGKYKALFEMDFMKKAREQQQLKAKEEAQKLLREIEQMEEGMSDSESEGEDQQQQKGNQKNQKTKESLAKHKEKLEQARKQMTDLMTGNSMSLANQNGSSSLAVPQPKSSSSEISSSLQNNPWLDSSVATKARDVNAMIGDSSQGKVHQKAKQRNIKNAIIKSDDANSSQDILTLLHSHDEKDEKAGKRKKNQKIEVSQTEAGDGAEVDSNVKKDSKAEQQQPTRKPLLMQKSQQDLVNLAFAGPDYEADFEALKEKIIDEELDISDKKRKILSDGK
jgi:U3 small nucleolar RNA-associated protein 14